MPFKIIAEQKAFTFTLSEAALPVGKVERWGGIPYLLCCPLCGMLHEIRGGSTLTLGEYEPACIVKQTHPAAYSRWLASFPMAADYKRVSLLAQRMQTPNIIPLPSQPGTVDSDAKAA
jgi:hypothetical protein